MKEIWKPIPNYEGMYEASDMGRIRSVSRIVKRNGGTNKTLSGRVLVTSTQGNGYKCVTLSQNGCVRTYRVHRLVAITFIPNPKGLPEVNHINENKADNSVSNLEWITHIGNIKHGTQIERSHKHRDCKGANNGMFGRKGKLSPVSKRVAQITPQVKVIAEYDSLREAAKSIGRTPNSITNAIIGRTSHCCGYQWKIINN